MEAYFWKDIRGEVVHRTTDAIDILTEKYTIRIRISGITIFRNARPKKEIPQRKVYEEELNLS